MEPILGSPLCSLSVLSLTNCDSSCAVVLGAKGVDSEVGRPDIP